MSSNDSIPNPMAARRSAAFSYSAILLGSLTLVLLINYVRASSHYLKQPGFLTDLEIFYQFALRLHALPVDESAQQTHDLNLGNAPTTFGFGYAPTAFGFLWLFGYLPAKHAWLIWSLCNHLLLLLCCVLTAGLASPPLRMRTLRLVVPLFLASAPAIQNLKWGQLNLFLLLLMALHLCCVHRRWDILGGIFLGMCCAIKPYPGILGIPLLLNRRWRAVSATFSTLVVAAVVPCVLTRTNLWTWWLGDPVQMWLHASWAGFSLDQSLQGYLVRLLDPRNPFVTSPFNAPGLVRPIAGGVLLGSLCVLSWLMHRGGRRERTGPEDRVIDIWHGMVFLSAMLAISPASEEHYFVWPLIPLSWLLVHPQMPHWGGGRRATIALTTAMLVAQLPYDHHIFLHGLPLLLSAPRLFAAWALTLLVICAGPRREPDAHE